MALLLLLLLGFPPSPSSGQLPGARIAYLAQGEVWSISAAGGVPARVTRTGGRVEDFRYSRDGAFLVYARRIGQGDNGPNTSLVVLRAAAGVKLIELTPTEGTFSPDLWLGTTLVYHAASAMEVSGFFEYDAATGIRRELAPGDSVSPLDRDVSADGSLAVFVDNVGLGPTFRDRLHYRTTSAPDRVRAEHRSVMVPAIAPDARSVAFLEVVDSPGTPSRPSRDRVWVHRGDDSEIRIYDGPVRAKGGGSGLSWSPDGRMVAMNFSGRTLVLRADSSSAPLRDIAGNDACWLDPGRLVIEYRGVVQVVEVGSGEARPLARDAGRPQCLTG